MSYVKPTLQSKYHVTLLLYHKNKNRKKPCQKEKKINSENHILLNTK